MELIDKDALVEKLGEWRYKIVLGIATIPLHGREKADAAFEYELLGKVKDFVNTFDTIETKDMDLKEDVDRILYENDWDYDEIDFYEFARHFFELGLKAKGWREERMKECPYRQVGCTMYSGTILECRGACSWVVDYPKLKELEEKKGE